jgi:hypothetical protein
VILSNNVFILFPSVPYHRKLANLGVPQLRNLFSEIFGEQTASNNAAWLRRKLSESPDGVYGQGRCVTVRARDLGAAIWNSNNHMVTHGKACHPQQQHHQHQVHHNNSGAGGSVCSGDQSPTGSWSMSTASGSSDGSDQDLQQGQQMLGGGGARAGQFRRCRTEKRAAGGESGGEEESLRDDEEEQYGGGGRGGRWSGTGGSHMPVKRHVITWEEFGDEFVGTNIEVYWPEDNTWWAATILEVRLGSWGKVVDYVGASHVQDDVAEFCYHAVEHDRSRHLPL